jgi:hypothetical protein
MGQPGTSGRMLLDASAGKSVRVNISEVRLTMLERDRGCRNSIKAPKAGGREVGGAC